MLKFFIVIVPIISIATIGGTQSYFIEKAPLSNIITNSSVEDIYQDNQGFVWFATHTGLVQYSGSYSRVFSPQSRVGQRTESEFFYKIAEDINNNLWIGSRNGLVFIDSTRNNAITYKPGPGFPLPNARIFDLFFYCDSLLFLACDRSGLTSLNIHTFELNQMEPVWNEKDPPLERIWVRQYWKGSDNNLYIRTSEGFFIYHLDTNELTRIQDTTLSNFARVKNIIAFGQDHRDDFWLVDSEFKLVRWRPSEDLEIFSPIELEEISRAGLFGVFPFDSTRIVIASNKGNFLFNPITETLDILTLRGNNHFQPSDGRLVSIGHTREGQKFVGFRAGITGMINPRYQDFQFVSIPKERQDEVLSSVFVLDDEEYGNRFISTFLYPSIIVEDIQTGKFSEIPKKYPGNLSSNKMLIDSDGRLWITQNRGLMLVDRNNLSTTFYDAPENTTTLFEIAEVSPGEFFVGSFREGLFRFVPDRGIFEKVEEVRGWIRTQIFSMAYDDNKNTLWIGTVRNGLLKYDIERDTFFHFMPDRNNPHSIGGDWIRSLEVGPDGKVWFAVDPVGIGSFCHDLPLDSAFQSYGLNEGLPSNFVAGIVFDKNGLLWMSSLRGIASFDTRTKEVSIYQPDNGTRNQTFYYNNMSVNANNEIFTGSSNGYFKFNPSQLSTSSVPPKVRLIDIEVLGRGENSKLDPLTSNGLQLKSNENNLRIEFAVINFTQPEENKIFYQLESQLDNWQVVTGVNQIYFSQLAPGTYNFRLKAMNGDGVWSTNELNIPIFIAKPYYNTWWFYSILIFTAGAVFFFAYRYQLKSKIKENQLETEKENIRSRMEKELADLKLLSLRSQMNPHFIFNCLNSINRFILVNDNDSASEYLTKFSKLIRKVLDNSREDKISIEKDIETLKLYIEMEKMRFIKKFDYEIIIDAALNLQDLKIQPMLIQPFVENAIWHGLMHKSEKGFLEINVGKKEGELYIQVKDNGIGREESKKIRSGLQFKHKSYGMRVTRERMEMERYHSHFVSKTQIADLYDNEGKSTGTLVEIFLPIEKEDKVLTT